MEAPKFNPPYGRIEDVPEPLLDRATYFVVYGPGDGTRSARACRLLADITNAWMLHGQAVIAPNALAREYGRTRRTICRLIRQMKERGAIVQIGRSDTGSPIFVPNLSITEDEYLQDRRDLEIEMAEYDRLDKGGAHVEA